MFYKSMEISLDTAKVKAAGSDSSASFEIFVPNTDKEVVGCNPVRPTVIILPGGGYARTSGRGEPIAMRFMSCGYNACILHYTCAPAVFPVSFLQTLTAVKYIRDNAGELHADPNKIYVCGFSAGGHLAASVGPLWHSDIAEKYFGDTECIKPNGLILGYPVISTNAEFCHEPSFENLLGDNKDNALLRELMCLEKQVSRKTPPCFIWHTFEDMLVPCENSLSFALALKKCGVPFELHIYELGGHGGATGDKQTCDSNYRLGNWMREACEWLASPRARYLDV